MSTLSTDIIEPSHFLCHTIHNGHLIFKIPIGIYSLDSLLFLHSVPDINGMRPCIALKVFVR